MCGPSSHIAFFNSEKMNSNSATVMEKSVPTTKKGDKRANGIFP